MIDESSTNQKNAECIDNEITDTQNQVTGSLSNKEHKMDYLDEMTSENKEEIMVDEFNTNPRSADAGDVEVIENLNQIDESVLKAEDEIEPLEGMIADAETETITINSVVSMLTSLSEKVDNLNTLFNEKIKHSERDDKLIIDMNNELMKYKENLYSKLLKPLLLDIIDFRESMLKYLAGRLTKPESEQIVSLKTFESYAVDILDIIEKYEVTTYHGEPGEKYKPLLQKITKKVPTANEGQHGFVVSSLSCGYLMNDKVLIPEKVSVYVYDSSLKASEDTNGSETM